jgi:chromosome segregation ATPase
MASMQDPFYVVKEEVNDALQAVGEMYDKWKDLLEHTNTSTNDEFKWVTNELKTGLRGIESDLLDLEETIGIVEKDKAKFRIDDNEIASRKSFVTSTRRRMQAIKEEMSSTKTKGKMEADSRSNLMQQSNSTNRFSRFEAAVQQDNENFIEGQQQRQQTIFRQQDEGLDQLSHTVVTLKDIANTIDTTLEEQNGLIGEIEKETDKADSGLKGAVKKVNQLIDSTKDGTQLTVIVILILLLIGLVVLVFYV